MPTKNARLEKLREEQRLLAEKIREIEAREKEQARKEDQRRQTLAGTLILETIAREPDGTLAKAFHALLDKQVTKPADRELLGLKPKAEPKSKPAEKAQ